MFAAIMSSASRPSWGQVLPLVPTPEPFYSIGQDIERMGTVSVPLSLEAKVSAMDKEERERELVARSCAGYWFGDSAYDESFVRLLLSVGTDPNASGPNPGEDNISSEPALMVAAGCSSLSSVDALLKAGADTEGRDISGRTALIKAAGIQPPATQYGYGDIVGRLLKGGSKVNAADNGGNTPLMYLTRATMARALLGLPSDERAYIEEGNEDYDAVLRQLIAAGADPDAANLQGETALIQCVPPKSDANRVHAYRECCPLEMILTLIEAGADIDKKNQEGKTALELASEAEREVYHRRVNCAMMGIALDEISRGGTLAAVLSRFRSVNYTSIHVGSAASNSGENTDTTTSGEEESTDRK